MATIVMIYGQSGTGKSTSLRNFSKDDVSIVNVSGKPLPFRGGNGWKCLNSDKYPDILNFIQKTPKKSIVIDDATYLMVNAYMRNAKVTGFQKFTDMAYDFDNLVRTAATLPDDKIVYFIGHTEQSEDGREHFKTCGKMLDNTVTLEGRFTIVLKSICKEGQYYFSTHNNGMDTVKTPVDMFHDDLIPNDLKFVDTTIREYYKNESEEESK